MNWWSRPWSWMQQHARGIARTTWRLSLLLFLVAMTLNALILLDLAPGGHLGFTSLYYEPGFVLLAGLGAMIVIRWPDQVMGWLFCACGLIANITSTTLTYEQFAGIEPEPLLVPALWITNLLGATHLMILLLVVPYLFPSGRLMSQRWRPLLICSIVFILVGVVHDTIATDILGVDERRHDANPTYIPHLGDTISGLTPLWLVLLPVVLVGAVASLILRYRRSHGVEHLQIRWLAWMLSLILTFVFLFIAGQTLLPSTFNPDDDIWTLPELAFGLTALLLASIGIPLVMGLAVLRYRLYSIDLIVNRTLVYGALTLGLGATYWVGVVLLRQSLDPITPGSNLAVAGSTLAVAALFQPLRQRIQNVVDRRFFRHKYDAATTIDAFSVRLRNDVDLDSLLTDLRVVVTDTMQPASVSIWVRPPQRLDRP